MEEQNPLIETRKTELLNYIQSFYRRSWDWRSTRFHEEWDRYDRNFHSIYDPTKKAMKKPWQSTMFVDITLQNVEIITSQLFKTAMAPSSPIQMEAGPAGDELQAKLIQETMDYEFRKSMLKVAYYDCMKEKVRYGSGFIKLLWEKKVDTRRRRVPIEQTPEEVVNSAPESALMGETPMPQPMIKGFGFQNVEVLIKNCMSARHVHIRDIFPEPNTITWDRVIHRDKMTYGDIVRYIQRGEFFDVRDKIEDISEGEKFEADLQTIKNEQGYFDTQRILSKFEKKHTIWEFWGEIPRKWIQFDIPEGDEAEELVPAKAMVASGIALLASEENEKFDAEPPILKDDYIRTGDTYGKGICKMLLDDQDEINEHTNLGIDNMNLLLNKMLVVLENALVNIEQDVVSQPGGIIRLKQSVVDDVRKGIMTLDFPDLANSYFKHRFDIERLVQDKTGANRMTLGSVGVVKDTNQTLGGMELLRQMFNERIAAYGMISEAAFLNRIAEKTYGLIYQELTPEDLKTILGEEPIQIGVIPSPIPGLPPMPHLVPRYLAFAFVPPEEIYRSYRFKPMGIFSMENKLTKAAQFMDWAKLFAPVLNMSEAAKYSAKLMGNDEAEKMVLPMPILPPPGAPGAPMPPSDAPGMKGGPNGDRPNFLPPNPLNRAPVS